LPIVIDWVDTAERVAQLLPRVRERVQRGLITVEDTEVAYFCPTPVRDVPAGLKAGDVMSRDVVSVGRDTPVRAAVEQMVGQTYRALPVLEGGRPVGLITNTDLLLRGGLTIRVDLLPSLEKPDLKAELEQLSKAARTAADVMTPNPLTVGEATPLTKVAELMAARRFKRLPVVDERGALVGMVSRVDVLRTAARTFEAPESGPGDLGLAADAPIGRAMRRDVPTVFLETPLPQVVQAVISTRLNRCVVVDHERRVLGKVTDVEVLERVTPAMRPSTLRSLMHRVPFAHPNPHEREIEQHAAARSAKDLMVPVAFVVGEGRPLREAITAMLPGKHKILAVVDLERRLLGILDRADLLHGLLHG